MTYTNEWSVTRPLGSAQANTVDDEIRALRVDIEERIGPLFEDFSADPLVVDQTKFGAHDGKIMVVSGIAFQIETAVANYDDTGMTNIPSGAGPARAWVPLPSGVTVVKIEWLVSNNDTAAIAVSFGSMAFDLSMATEQHITGSTVASGLTLIDSGEIAVPIQEGRTYFLKADKGGGDFFGIRAVKITYNCPDGRSTI